MPLPASGKRPSAAAGEFARFLLVGGMNTAVAYAAYLLLVGFLAYPLAWGIAYLAGIAVGYVANSLFVFKQPLRHRSALAYGLIYLGQYLLGVLLLKAFLDVFGLPHWISALAVIAITIPVTFVFVRQALKAG